MPSRGLKFDIRTGEPIEDDDDVLRDGQKIVVPLNMCDSQQREVIEHFAALRLQDEARRANYILDRETLRRIDDVREQAYLDMKSELQSAWKNPPPVTDVRGDQRQDAVPRMMTMDQAQAIKDRAYAEMVAELTEAWRR